MAPEHPQISVVMAVHNEERFVKDAVDSILGQSLADFEFIIIDDASSDRSKEILQNYARSDPRIRLVVNESNLGLTRSLNIGLNAINGDFVARMDADDVSLPRRFEDQLKVFRQHPDVVLAGTATISIDEDGKRKAIGGGPADPDVLRWYSVFRPPIAHPSAMFRAELVRRGLRYDERLRTAQDYELWSRMLQYGNATVIQEPLLLYRQHSQSISSGRSQEQAKTAATICRINLLRDFPEFFECEDTDKALQLAGFLYNSELGSSQEAAAAVSTILLLERNYLHSLGDPRTEVYRAIRRLTARWVMQSLFANRALGLFERFHIIGDFLGHALPLIQESYHFIGRRLKARNV